MNSAINLITLTLLFFGCGGSGVSVGAGSGSADGGVISHSAGGAIIGGPIGSVKDNAPASLSDNDRLIMEEKAPTALEHIDQGKPLTLQDIKDMSRAGIKEDVIINQMHVSQSTYFLSETEIKGLRNAGVSQKVIDAMMLAK